MVAWHTNANLYHQWEEAEARADKWERIALQEREAHKKEVITSAIKCYNETLKGAIRCKSKKGSVVGLR